MSGNEIRGTGIAGFLLFVVAPAVFAAALLALLVW